MDQHVAEAAEMLDGIRPGWENLVDTDQLNMMHPCILDFVFQEDVRVNDPHLYELFADYGHGGHMWAHSNVPELDRGNVWFADAFASGKLDWLEEIKSRRAITRTAVSA